jgi:hypothetical protein
MNERDLWTAVLVQAICDLTSADGNRYHRATLRYFARLWFESDNHQPSSFHWICDHIELDASWLRRRIFEMADRKTSVSMHLFTSTLKNEATARPIMPAALPLIPISPCRLIPSRPESPFEIVTFGVDPSRRRSARGEFVTISRVPETENVTIYSSSFMCRTEFAPAHSSLWN